MADESPSFSPADYVVFSTSLLISFLIGMLQWWRSRGLDTKDLLMGGGHMSPLPVALSLMAGVVSAISILGNSSEMYYYGSQLWMNCLGLVIGSIITALIIMPIIFPFKFINMYQFLEFRWTWILRKMTSLVQVVNGFLYMGICLYAPSQAISSVTPFSTNASIVVLGVVCGIYASFGGAKAVVYTDTFQSLVMFAGVIAVIIQGCIEVGGGQNAWQIDKENGRIEFFNMDPSPLERHTFMTTTILGFYFAFSTYGAAQSQYMRWGSMNTLKQAYIVMAVNVVGLVALWSLINYAGLVVYAVYADCDPYTAGYIDKTDQILVYFVVDKLGYLPGIPGLFVAAVYSGVLSSVSSSLNAVTAMMWKDFLQPLKVFSQYSEAKAKNVNIFISLVSSAATVGLGVLAGSMGGLVQVSYSIGGALAGPITGLFFTAILCPWVKSRSALLGFLCALGLNLWIVFGNFLYAPATEMLPLSTEGCNNTANCTSVASTEATTTTTLWTTIPGPAPQDDEVFPLYLLSYCLYGAIGILTCFCMSSVFSCFVGFEKPADVPREAVNTTCLKFYCWLRRENYSAIIKNQPSELSSFKEGNSDESRADSRPPHTKQGDESRADSRPSHTKQGDESRADSRSSHTKQGDESRADSRPPHKEQGDESRADSRLPHTEQGGLHGWHNSAYDNSQ